MELRTMRYFLAVAREENMTRAAEILHVTQPTLSKQLKSLEDELGKKLFTRHSFSIQLTEEGVLLRIGSSTSTAKSITPLSSFSVTCSVSPLVIWYRSLVWKKYQVFTPIAERLLNNLREKMK